MNQSLLESLWFLTMVFPASFYFIMSPHVGRDKSHRIGELLTVTINFCSILATLDNSIWQEKDHASFTAFNPFGILCITLRLICIVQLCSTLLHCEINDFWLLCYCKLLLMWTALYWATFSIELNGWKRLTVEVVTFTTHVTSVIWSTLEQMNIRNTLGS